MGNISSLFGSNTTAGAAGGRELWHFKIFGDAEWTSIWFDEANHASVGLLAAAVSKVLRAPDGAAQTDIKVFRVKYAHEVAFGEEPSAADCEAAIAGQHIVGTTDLREAAARRAVLPDRCWLVLRLREPIRPRVREFILCMQCSVLRPAKVCAPARSAAPPFTRLSPASALFSCLFCSDS